MTEIAEIHSNGGGRRERTVTCAKSAYLDPDTVISGAASIWGNPGIYKSKIGGYCRISGNPEILECDLSGRWSVSDSTRLSRVSGHTGETVQRNGDFFDVQFGEIEIRDKAVLRDCKLVALGPARIGIGELAELRWCVINGNAHIGGDAHLGQCNIEDGSWIMGGIWDGRAPRVVKTGAFFDCTESHIENEVFIGCQSRRIDAWIKQGPMLAERYGLSLDEFNHYAAIVKGWK